ncbi:hypothetical protein H0H92_010624 [Tricholoma furcatifolium]|nr:hypothetical protein H0H92_010624 [Tricholoma furcatifolium]
MLTLQYFRDIEHMDFDLDTVLLEKLKNVASVSNDDILSEGELVQCRRLLAKAQEQLLSIDPQSNEVELARLTCLIQTLSIALSSQRRLPPEILERIFCFLIPDTKSWMWLPPTKATLSMPPWSLGQVCRTWRHISRSIPELWGMVNIYFIHKMYVNADVEKEFHYSSERALNALRCANELLPRSVRVRVSGVDGHDLTAKDWLHLSGSITDLHWAFGDSIPFTLHPRLFSGLVSLRFTNAVWHTDVSDTRDLFGPSPRLQNLQLCSDTPSFLLTDIPWHQLHSFSLEIVWVEDSSLSVWRKFVALSPSVNLHSLKELRLQLPGKLQSIIFSFNFPWRQLTSLSITWTVPDTQDGSETEHQYLTKITQALQKCASLTQLSLSANDYDAPKYRYPAFRRQVEGLAMPLTLCSLTLRLDISTRLPNSVHSSESFRVTLSNMETWSQIHTGILQI